MESLDRRALLGVAGLVGAAALARSARGGPLNPPPGPIAPTPGPEPRIAINQTNTPGDAACLYRITQAGSYYLTENVQGVEGKAGILVSASFVTIDLRGFVMLAFGNSGKGIATANFARDLTVLNGTLIGWLAGGIESSSRGLVVSDVLLDDCTSFGIKTWDTSTISRCTVRASLVGYSLGLYSVVSDCFARENYQVGFTAYQNATILRCHADYCTNCGFVLDQGSIAEQCAATGALTGFAANRGSMLTDCSARRNFQNGFSLDEHSIATRCDASMNTGHGFRIGQGCRVSSCTATKNIAAGQLPGDGFFSEGNGSRIDDCHSVSNVTGFRAVQSGNIFTRNTAQGNTQANYALVPANAAGSALSLTSAAGQLNLCNAWANFQF